MDSIFAQFRSPTSPGCAVGVSRHGRPILERAYGMANLEYDVPNTPETVFEAGSVSKQFTAAAIVLLAQQGKLSLDDPVRKYIPELPDYGVPLTVRHMLTHTSGLRDWGSVVAAAGWPRGARVHTHAHVLDVVSRQKALNFPPGAEYSYSNTGYNLAAVLVERVSGESFATFSRKALFQPLGLTRTEWRDDYERVVKGRATAYSRDRDGVRQNMPFENVHGNGGLLTTVGDLLRWTEHLQNPTVVGGPAFVAEMERRGRLTSGREIEYASGLFVTTYRGVREVSHTGATAGYRAFLARYPEQRLAVALLCNLANVNPGQLGHRVVDVFLAPAAVAARPDIASAAPPTIALPAADLTSRAGTYRDLRTNEPMRLVVRADTLRVDGGVSLVPLSRTEFRSPNGNTYARFALGAGGRPTGVTMWYPLENADTARYAAVPDARPTAATLGGYAGEYVSDEAEVTYRVAVEDGALVLRLRPDRRIELTPAYRDAFTARGVGLVLFRRDQAGRVTGLSLGASRLRDLRFVKVK